MGNFEFKHENVYGEPFSKIEKKEIIKTTSNYRDRFKKNPLIIRVCLTIKVV